MTVACTACGASLEVAEDRIGSSNTKVACPTCEHVFAVGEAAPGEAAPGEAPPGKGAIPPKRVPPPVSGELTKTRRMSTDDMPFRVEMKTAPDGRQVAVVFCVASLTTAPPRTLAPGSSAGPCC